MNAVRDYRNVWKAMYRLRAEASSSPTQRLVSASCRLKLRDSRLWKKSLKPIVRTEIGVARLILPIASIEATGSV